MTKDNFEKLWLLNYPNTSPIPHLFKKDYSERWFRIHSLPESKRYAETEQEWTILLSRQNKIITDLFGNNTTIFIVTGEYYWFEQRKVHISEVEETNKPFSFVKLNRLQLNNIDPEQYNEEDFYRPAFAQTIWKINEHNNLLREIANDNSRAFFVSFDKNIIIAPYDGGIDFVLKDVLTKDNFKNKYRYWLSDREDGL